MKSRYADFFFVTEHAKNDNNMSYKCKVQFHYFNENGLYAKLKKAEDRIGRAVDAGVCRPGMLLVHGSLGHTFEVDELRRLNDKKRVSRIDFLVWKELTENEINKANEQAEELGF